MTFVNKFFNLFSNSFVNKILQNVVNYIQKLLLNSRIVGFFANYEKYENAVTDSYFFKNISAFYNMRRNKIHNFFARQLENSRFFVNVKLIFSDIKGIQAGQLGVGILGLGFTSAVIGISFYYSNRVLELFNDRLVLGLIFCIFSIAFVAKKHTSLSTLMQKSKLVRFFIIYLAGVREELLVGHIVKDKSYIKAFFYGIVTAIPLIFFDFNYYLLGILALIFLVIIFNSPEFGLLSILFAIPFLSVSYLLILTVVVVLSLISKAIRGKRYFKISIFDFVIFIFALCILYSLTVSVAPSISIKQVSVFLVFLSVYFLCSKLIITKKYAYISVTVLFISVAISTFIGVYQNIFGKLTSLIGIDTHLFFNITGILKGPFDNGVVYGQFIAAFLPLALAFFFMKRKLSRWFSCLVAIIMIISIFYVNSKIAILAAFVGTFVFIIFYNRFFIKLFILSIFALPFANHAVALDNIIDTSSSYKVSIWQGSYRLMKEVWTTGIGPGSGIFILAYPMYSIAEASNAIHSHNLFLQVVIEYGITGAITLFCMLLIFASLITTGLVKVKDTELSAIILAMGCGMLTLLIGAVTDNIWYNSKIFLIFFVIMGITQGSFNAYKNLRREYL